MGRPWILPSLCALSAVAFLIQNTQAAGITILPNITTGQRLDDVDITDSTQDPRFSTFMPYGAATEITTAIQTFRSKGDATADADFTAFQTTITNDIVKTFITSLDAATKTTAGATDPELQKSFVEAMALIIMWEKDNATAFRKANAPWKTFIATDVTDPTKLDAIKTAIQAVATGQKDEVKSKYDTIKKKLYPTANQPAHIDDKTTIAIGILLEQQYTTFALHVANQSLAENIEDFIKVAEHADPDSTSKNVKLIANLKSIGVYTKILTDAFGVFGTTVDATKVTAAEADANKDAAKILAYALLLFKAQSVKDAALAGGKTLADVPTLAADITTALQTFATGADKAKNLGYTFFKVATAAQPATAIVTGFITDIAKSLTDATGQASGSTPSQDSFLLMLAGLTEDYRTLATDLHNYAKTAPSASLNPDYFIEKCVEGVTGEHKSIDSAGTPVAADISKLCTTHALQLIALSKAETDQGAEATAVGSAVKDAISTINSVTLANLADLEAKITTLIGKYNDVAIKNPKNSVIASNFKGTIDDTVWTQLINDGLVLVASDYFANRCNAARQELIAVPVQGLKYATDTIKHIYFCQGIEKQIIQSHIDNKKWPVEPNTISSIVDDAKGGTFWLIIRKVLLDAFHNNPIFFDFLSNKVDNQNPILLQMGIELLKAKIAEIRNDMKNIVPQTNVDMDTFFDQNTDSINTLVHDLNAALLDTLIAAPKYAKLAKFIGNTVYLDAPISTIAAMRNYITDSGLAAPTMSFVGILPLIKFEYLKYYWMSTGWVLSDLWAKHAESATDQAKAILAKLSIDDTDPATETELETIISKIVGQVYPTSGAPTYVALSGITGTTATKYVIDDNKGKKLFSDPTFAAAGVTAVNGGIILELENQALHVAAVKGLAAARLAVAKQATAKIGADTPTDIITLSTILTMGMKYFIPIFAPGQSDLVDSSPDPDKLANIYLYSYLAWRMLINGDDTIARMSEDKSLSSYQNSYEATLLSQIDTLSGSKISKDDLKLKNYLLGCFNEYHDRNQSADGLMAGFNVSDPAYSALVADANFTTSLATPSFWGGANLDSVKVFMDLFTNILTPNASPTWAAITTPLGAEQEHGVSEMLGHDQATFEKDGWLIYKNSPAIEDKLLVAFALMLNTASNRLGPIWFKLWTSVQNTLTTFQMGYPILKSAEDFLYLVSTDEWTGLKTASGLSDAEFFGPAFPFSKTMGNLKYLVSRWFQHMMTVQMTTSNGSTADTINTVAKEISASGFVDDNSHWTADQKSKIDSAISSMRTLTELLDLSKAKSSTFKTDSDFLSTADGEATISLAEKLGSVTVTSSLETYGPTFKFDSIDNVVDLDKAIDDATSADATSVKAEAKKWYKGFTGKDAGTKFDNISSLNRAAIIKLAVDNCGQNLTVIHDFLVDHADTHPIPKYLVPVYVFAKKASMTDGDIVKVYNDLFSTRVTNAIPSSMSVDVFKKSIRDFAVNLKEADGDDSDWDKFMIPIKDAFTEAQLKWPTNDEIKNHSPEPFDPPTLTAADYVYSQVKDLSYKDYFPDTSPPDDTKAKSVYSKDGNANAAEVTEYLTSLEPFQTMAECVTTIFQAKPSSYSDVTGISTLPACFSTPSDSGKSYLHGLISTWPFTKGNSFSSSKLMPTTLIVFGGLLMVALLF